ncbi:hypothetical protein ES676_09635 [Bizionia saleffrena]|uniref:Uncharacterized protein n=1 Tax=Bizionia saleffrena TaxID=291189 RepID=A0A8H2LBR8_9FLAO|nr:hypothetical protein ES676_09635 [Bizionia saleffrena]
MSQSVSHIRFSILGGTASSVWMRISSEDLIKTAIMAAFGAVVSYLVSLLVKCIHKRLKRLKLKD